MLRLVARQDTWLKKSTRHSSELPANKKHAISKGEQVVIDKYQTIEGSDNIIADLAYSQGKWIIYTKHFSNYDVDPPVKTPKSSINIDWTDFECKISRHFTVGEALNWDMRRLPQSAQVKKNIILLAQELDKVRDAWGAPIMVNSWYRDPVTNRRIGGAVKSQHMTGGAADIRPVHAKDGLKFEKWLDTGIWKNRALGYGQRGRRGFTHVDLRPGYIRWNY
jgi:putative chitinase